MILGLDLHRHRARCEQPGVRLSVCSVRAYFGSAVCESLFAASNTSPSEKGKNRLKSQAVGCPGYRGYSKDVTQAVS
jgi:hypothetical protein